MQQASDQEDRAETLMSGPQSRLEMMYLEEYLESKGYHFRDLCTLPEEEAKHLMIEACRYASARLAEVEARARFQQEIHGITQTP